MGPAAGVTVSGNGHSRVFQVDGGRHGVNLGNDDHRRHTDHRRNGGGLDNDGGNVTLTKFTVSGNYANGNGGGLWNAGGTATLTNCTVNNNTTPLIRVRRRPGQSRRHDHAHQLHRQRQLRRIRRRRLIITAARPR